jgi:hypothetical protein
VKKAMKRLTFLSFILIVFVAFGCRSSYNEDAVKKLIERPGIRAWADTFENNSNLIHSEHFEVMVVSSKELPGREVRAIKDYLKDKYETESVNYYYRENAYQYGVDSTKEANK